MRTRWARIPAYEARSRQPRAAKDPALFSECRAEGGRKLGAAIILRFCNGQIIRHQTVDGERVVLVWLIAAALAAITDGRRTALLGTKRGLPSVCSRSASRIQQSAAAVP